MIFEALQSELVGFDFYLLRSIIQKIPEFNLNMIETYVVKTKTQKIRQKNAFVNHGTNNGFTTPVELKGSKGDIKE